jgi:histidine triad (HIT) family protein
MRLFERSDTSYALLTKSKKSFSSLFIFSMNLFGWVMMEEGVCMFCQIVAKRVPAYIVYENEYSLSFLDIRPASIGHTLLVPRKHFEKLVDVPSTIIKELAISLQTVSACIVEAVNADGLNVLQNNGRAAGQVIPHVHFHLIPRFNEDGLHLGAFREVPRDDKLMKQVYERIRSCVLLRKSNTI